MEWAEVRLVLRVIQTRETPQNIPIPSSLPSLSILLCTKQHSLTEGCWTGLSLYANFRLIASWTQTELKFNSAQKSHNNNNKQAAVLLISLRRLYAVSSVITPPPPLCGSVEELSREVAARLAWTAELQNLLSTLDGIGSCRNHLSHICNARNTKIKREKCFQFSFTKGHAHKLIQVPDWRSNLWRLQGTLLPQRTLLLCTTPHWWTQL